MCLSSVYGARCCAACVCVCHGVLLLPCLVLCVLLYFYHCNTVWAVASLRAHSHVLPLFCVAVFKCFALILLLMLILACRLWISSLFDKCVCYHSFTHFFLTCCFECTLQFAVDEFASATYGRKYMIVCIYGICTLFVQTMWMNESHCYRPNKMSVLQLHWMRVQCTIKYALFLSLIPLSSNDHSYRQADTFK